MHKMESCVLLQVVHAHAYSFSLRGAFWIVQSEVAPSCDEVDDCHGIPLSRLSQLNDANALLSVVEALKESALHFINPNSQFFWVGAYYTK